MLRWLAAMCALALPLLACSDEDVATPSPAPTEPTATASAEAATSTSTPEAATAVPTPGPYLTGLWLVEVATGDLHRLYDGRLDAGGEFPAVSAPGFLPGGDRIQLRLGEQSPVVFDLDGRVVEELEGVRWRQTSLDGRVVYTFDVGADRNRIAIDGLELSEDVWTAEAAGDRAVLRVQIAGADRYSVDVLDLRTRERLTLAEDVQVVCCHGAPFAISPRAATTSTRTRKPPISTTSKRSR